MSVIMISKKRVKERQTETEVTQVTDHRNNSDTTTGSKQENTNKKDCRTSSNRYNKNLGKVRVATTQQNHKDHGTVNKAEITRSNQVDYSIASEAKQEARTLKTQCSEAETRQSSQIILLDNP